MAMLIEREIPITSGENRNGYVDREGNTYYK